MGNDQISIALSVTEGTRSHRLHGRAQTGDTAVRTAFFASKDQPVVLLAPEETRLATDGSGLVFRDRAERRHADPRSGEMVLCIAGATGPSIGFDNGDPFNPTDADVPRNPASLADLDVVIHRPEGF